MMCSTLGIIYHYMIIAYHIMTFKHFFYAVNCPFLFSIFSVSGCGFGFGFENASKTTMKLNYLLVIMLKHITIIY